MEKIRVLMVDDNVRLVDAVKEYFKNNEEVEVVLEAHDGAEGLEVIKNNLDNFDVLLLDLIMPNKDGMYVLEEAKNMGLDKKIIVETSYNAGDVIREVSELGADYLVLKPFELTDLEKRIKEVMKRKTGSKNIDYYNSNVQVAISKVLHDLGIPSHIKGYQFLRDAIFMIFENTDIIGGITKEIYPELASRYSTTTSRVERAIRHAIEISWTRGDIKLMNNIFGHSVDVNRDKPTNSEFIVTLADKMRLDFYKINT